MNAVLAQTLVWTGILIAAVLLLRRPVARHLGPQFAYALWAVPVARLLLPPITLPASMRLTAPEAVSAPLPAEAEAIMPVADALPPVPVEAPLPAAIDPGGFDLIAFLSDLPLIEGLLVIWLGGAGVFLCRRFAAYFDLRDELLTSAREMGRIHTRFRIIRLMETPATAAPLAMGVLDPVIVLPPGFMALYDRQARDLALAHELAHHHGGDLLVNVLVQPLFALHWWNPLARYGWLAMRCDQEAACDARVMARRNAAERAAYATLIARYAAAPSAPSAASNAALTAPMACPVLGDKSIIQRLRNLSMPDLSPRRRMAGRALLGAGLLILPLTASISYAASEAVQSAPEAPEPAEPGAPPAVAEAPQAPEAPDAPEAPEAPLAFLFLGRDDDAEGDANVVVTEHTERGEGGEERKVKIVRRISLDGDDEERDVRIPRKFDWEGKTIHLDTRKAEWMSKEEHEKMRAALREGLAEAERVRGDLPRILAEAMAEADAARAAAPRFIVRRECQPGSDAPSASTTDANGNTVVTICRSNIEKLALPMRIELRSASPLHGLEQARNEIAQDQDIPEDTRSEMLKHLDRQIARWKEKAG